MINKYTDSIKFLLVLWEALKVDTDVLPGVLWHRERVIQSRGLITSVVSLLTKSTVMYVALAILY